MKTTSTLALRAAVLTALVTNGCVHTEIAQPPQTSVNAGPPPAVAAARAQPGPPAVSPAAAEVVRLAEAGTSDDVILAYIQNDTAPFELSADQILYLRDIGVSQGAITAMLSRDNVLRSQAIPAGAPPPAPVEPPAVAVSAPLVPETPPVYVGSPPPEVGYFYDDLSPYGTWVQLDGVGWCWQPRVVVVNRGWRPYCDSGHWVFTDAGWFWQSDYSWGWAPFHYGRWQLHERCGWVWTPDRVWGPAWVTWRSEGDRCGWAPLPPRAEFDVHAGYRFNGVAVAATFDFGLRPDHFTFIAVRDFHDHDYVHRRLPPTEVTRIYNHTTVINNYVVNNNTVINQGIRPEQVASATHTEIHKVAIRNVSAPSAAVAASRGSARGDLAVYRPALTAPARPVNIVAQKVDQNHPIIQRPPPVATTPQRPLVATSVPNLERENPNRGGQNSTSSSARGTVPGQTQTAPRGSVPQPSKATPGRPQVMSSQPAANPPSNPSRPAPNTSDNRRSGATGQNPTVSNPRGNSQAGDGRNNNAQANPRPAERGNANGRESSGRGQENRRNDQ